MLGKYTTIAHYLFKQSKEIRKRFKKVLNQL